MIKSLSISNYALIDNIELSFSPGLNIITGETGAGKSIILGALSMLFGNRADTKVVSDKTQKSVVEAVFDIRGYEFLKPVFEENDIDWDDQTLILRREITPAGRSRSFVNDVPASLTVLRQIAMHLVDIHSQHQNNILLSPDYQLAILDSLLSSPLREEYDTAYSAYRHALKKYQKTKRAISEAAAEEEYLRFQLAKLEDMNLEPGEQDELENDRNLLANIGEIKESLSHLNHIFSESDDNIVSSLKMSEQLISSVRNIKEAAQIDERIESLRIEAADLAATISTLNDSIEANPKRLEAIEERLADIYTLQRKFGTDSVEGLIEKRDEIRAKLETIDNSEEELRECAVKAKSAKKTASEIAEKLTDARKEVARSFCRQLIDTALPLGMKNLVIDIAFNPTELSPTGADDVSFLFAFNKNQPLMSIRDTGSGGEISRVMLSIKAVVADRIQLPSLIFDEIDTGVSGDVANRIGQLMKDISRKIQVISITHLPQVAAKGETHFRIFKEDSETHTNTRVCMLTPDQRISELALMLSGSADNKAARETAKSLLNDQQ